MRETTIPKQIKERIVRMVTCKDEKSLTDYEIFLSRFTDLFDDDIMKADERLYSISRSKDGYGTWKFTIWFNEYHFDGFANLAEWCEITTHDEDKVCTIEDFEDELKEMFDSYIFNIYNELPIYNGHNDAEFLAKLDELL